MSDIGERENRVEGRARIGGLRDDLDVADHVLAAPQGSDGFSPGNAGCLAQPRENRIGDRHRPAERNARNRRAQRRQGAGDRGFGRFIQAWHALDGVASQFRDVIRLFRDPDCRLQRRELLDRDRAPDSE